MTTDREESLDLELDFTKIQRVAATGSEVVPVVLQHADTGEVLYLAYANAQALEVTLTERIAVLWSTSRNELWRKGATSGDVLDLVDVRVNCEQNSLLYRVVPRTGGVCHTRDAVGQARSGCFYRTVTSTTDLDFVAAEPGPR